MGLGGVLFPPLISGGPIEAQIDRAKRAEGSERGQVQFIELIGNALAGVAKLDLSPFLPPGHSEMNAATSSD